MKKTALALLLTLAWGGSLAASVIYDNTTHDLDVAYVYSFDGLTQIGDTVTLAAGTGRVLGSVAVQFYNDTPNAGTFDAILRLFRTGSPVGTQIGPDFVITNVAVSSFGVATVTFNNLNLVVPDNLVFTQAIANPTGGVDMGVSVFGPPTVGSSNDEEFVTDDRNGGFVTQFALPGVPERNLAGFGNLYLQLTAVPEPGSWLMLFSGMAIVGFAQRKRR